MANIGTSTVAYATRQPTGQLVFLASDGSACVLWCDGTNQVIAYDDNTYASWTKATLTTGLNMCLAGDFRAGTDNIDEVTGGASNVRGNYRLLTKSGATWTVGASNVLSGTTAIGVTAQGSPTNYVGQDAQGRHWIVVSGATNTATTCYYSPANSPTSTGWTASGGATQTADLFLPAADQVGNYLVKILWNGTSLRWNRIDNSVVTLGAWTTAANIPNLAGSPNASSAVNFKKISATQGLLVYSSSSGVYAQLYTASTDTFEAATQLSTNANDRHPTIATDGAGNAWVVWCKYSAATNFSLVSKKWDGASWGAETELVAAGTNISYPNAGFGARTLGVAYTQGTASPYTVGWALQTFGGSQAISGVSAALDGPTSLTLYGSDTPDATLPNACDVATVAGGVETSKVTTISGGTGNFAEVWPKGGTVAAVAALPSNPTGHGWAYQPGAGTFNGATPWDAIITCANSDNSGSWRLRFFKYDGVATYTPITTLTTAITATAKTIYNFPASTVASVDFLATDWLVWDVYYETLYGAASNTVTCYEATDATAGVANEMQITTPVFTPAVSGVTSSRNLGSISAALLQTTTKTLSSVSSAVQQGNISKTSAGVSAALQSVGNTRGLSGSTAAVQARGLARGLSSISAATQQVFVPRALSGISAATQQMGVSRPLTGVSAATRFTDSRPLSGVSVSVGAGGITRPIASVSAALSASGVARALSLVGASLGEGFHDTFTRTVGGEIGLADTGQSYTLYRASSWSVDGSILQAVESVPPNWPSVSVQGFVLADGETHLTTRIGSSSNTTSLAIRDQGTTTHDCYRVSLSATQLWISRYIGNVALNLSVLPRAHDPNLWYHLKIRAGGDTISAKDWPDGQAEPASWDVIAQDSTFTQGHLTIQASCGSASIPLSFDDWTAQKTIERPSSGVSASVLFSGIRPISGISAALLAPGVARTLTTVSASMAATRSRPLASISACVSGSVSRPLAGISAATKGTTGRPLAGISAAIGQGGITRAIAGVSAALLALGQPRPLSSVSVAVKQTGVPRALSGVSVAVKQTGLPRPINTVSVAVQATGVRSLTGVSAATLATFSRTLSGISVALSGVASRPVAGVSAAIRATTARPLSGIVAGIGASGIERAIASVSVAVCISPSAVMLHVRTESGQMAVHAARGTLTVHGHAGTLRVRKLSP